jgi:hypothetical protein
MVGDFSLLSSKPGPQARRQLCSITQKRARPCPSTRVCARVPNWVIVQARAERTGSLSLPGEGLPLVSTIFISHSTKDDRFGTRLKHWLENQGYTWAFLDHSSIRGGEDWEERPYRELRRSDAMIVVCTEEWANSKWCFAELAVARALGRKNRIVPIKIAECTIPDELRSLQLHRLLT